MTDIKHIDYPHAPGSLYDCPACEAECNCDVGFDCVYCCDVFAATDDGCNA